MFSLLDNMVLSWYMFWRPCTITWYQGTIKGVLLCSFIKSWFCFGGVLEHALMLGGSKNALFSHNLHYYNTSLPSLAQTRLVPAGFDEGPPSEKRNVLWLVSCPSALWLANSLGASVLPRPLPKQQVHQYCHISSDTENIENRAEPLQARILQDILKL